MSTNLERDILKPIALAAFRLMAGSNFVGRWTGRSAGRLLT
jgi:hypothetical protein